MDIQFDDILKAEINEAKTVAEHWLNKLTGPEAQAAERCLARLAVLQAEAIAGLRTWASTKEQTAVVLNNLGFIKAKIGLEASFAAKEFLRGLATRAAGVLLAAATA